MALKDLRSSLIARAFYRVCSEHPLTVIHHKRAQELLAKAVVATSGGKFDRNLMRSLSAVLPQALAEEDGRNWVAQKLYPTLVRKMEDKKADEETRMRAVARIGQIASLAPERALETTVKRESEKKLLEIWFSNDTDANSKVAEELKRQLAHLATKHLFEQVKTRAKGPDKNAKAKEETLLKELEECLLPQRSAGTTEGHYEVHS